MASTLQRSARELEDHMMTRKQFLRSALDVAAATLGLTVLSACNSGTSPPPGVDAPGTVGSGSGPGSGAGSASACIQNGTSVNIVANHGHVLVVSKEDVAAAQAKTYDIMGTADHTHTVSITAAMFAQLASDQAIMTQSTVNTSATFGTHNHPVMVACA
jgi:hypothetical protein